MTFGEKIYKLRCDKNMTQDELARAVGYKSRSTIAKIESGERDVSQSMIVALAKALDTSPSFLMGWEEKSEPSSSLSTMKNFEKRDAKLIHGSAADLHCTANKGFITGGIGNTTITSAVPIKNGGEVVIRGKSSPASGVKIETVKAKQKDETIEFYETRFKPMSSPRYRNQLKQSVVERTSLIYGDERTAELLKAFKSLNDIGRSEAVKRVEELTLIPAYQNDKQEDEQASSDTSKLTEYKK